MKKWIILSLVCITFSSCKFDDKEVILPYSSVYLPYNDYNRNVVVGEGLKIKIGATLAGMVDNKIMRSVNYEIQPALIHGGSADSKSLLPANYYAMSDANTIFFQKGQLKSSVTVTLDSVAFLSDAKSLTGEFILPVKLISPNGIDKITEGKEFMRIAISYFAKQHGNYNYHGTITKAGETPEVVAYKNISTLTESVRQLVTVGPKKLRVVADSKNNDDPAKKHQYSFIIEVPTHGGGEVIITADPTSKVAITSSGTSSYDEKSKTFTLNYSYTVGADKFSIADILQFRNRIRDDQGNGQYLNEWRGF